MEDLDNILSRYKAGSHSPSDMEQIETMLSDGMLSMSDIEDFMEVSEAMSDEPDSATLARMDVQFYKLIEPKVVVSNTKKANKWIIVLATLVVLLTALSFYLLGQLNSKSSDELSLSPQQFTFALLKNDRVENRIHIVSNISKHEYLDEDIIDVLLYNLISDESVNVRLASINILKSYVVSPFVRQGLINAIPFQDSPIVLMYIKEAIELNGPVMNQNEFSTKVNQTTRPAFEQSLKSIAL